MKGIYARSLSHRHNVSLASKARWGNIPLCACGTRHRKQNAKNRNGKICEMSLVVKPVPTKSAAQERLKRYLDALPDNELIVGLQRILHHREAA